MSLMKCSECGNDISTKAESCPRCGAVLKKKTVPVTTKKNHGCCGCLVAFICIFIIIGAIGVLTRSDSPSKNNTTSSARQVHSIVKTDIENSSSAQKEKAKEPDVHREGETVHVGYTSYAVWSSWWSSQLSSNEFLNQRPNAMYLFVELTVRNNDKKARIVPPFTLVDENNAEYEASSNGWAVEGSIGLIESLNPSVSKQGFVVFDVPQEHKYRLKLSGGYWSTKDAFVQLNPKAHK
jgi:hypothetical protein